MKDTEQQALLYLQHLGYTDIQYEPIANKTPDFLINGRIAVEVRRLNINIRGKGIEEYECPFIDSFSKILANQEGYPRSETWFIDVTILGEFPEFSDVRQNYVNALRRFALSSNRTNSIIYSGTDAILEARRASIVEPSFYVLGGYDPSCGWVLADMERNIEHCARDKAGKINDVRSRYTIWWLALVDHISRATCDVDELRSAVQNLHGWDRILIISPLVPSSGIILDKDNIGFSGS
jgi:hypothetical protein